MPPIISGLDTSQLHFTYTPPQTASGLTPHQPPSSSPSPVSIQLLHSLTNTLHYFPGGRFIHTTEQIINCQEGREREFFRCCRSPKLLVPSTPEHGNPPLSVDTCDWNRSQFTERGRGCQWRMNRAQGDPLGLLLTDQLA